MSAVENLDQERRITFCLYEYWEKLAGNVGLPALKNMSREQIAPFKNHLTLLDLRESVDQPTFQVVGQALQEDLDFDLTHKSVSDVPRRTMISRIVDHYQEVLANRVPIAFEAEFVNSDGEKALYRGILLPFSDDNKNINFILGGVRWILEKDLTLDDTKPTIEELMTSIAARKPQHEQNEPGIAATQHDHDADIQEHSADQEAALQDDEELPGLDSEAIDEVSNETTEEYNLNDLEANKEHAPEIITDADPVVDVNSEDYETSEEIHLEDVAIEDSNPELMEEQIAVVEDVVEEIPESVDESLTIEEEAVIFSAEDEEGPAFDENPPAEDEIVLAENPADNTSEPALTKKDFLPETVNEEVEPDPISLEVTPDTAIENTDEHDTNVADGTEAERMASEILDSLNTQDRPGDAANEEAGRFDDGLSGDEDIYANDDKPEESPSVEQPLSFQEIVENQIESTEDISFDPPSEDEEITLIDALDQPDNTGGDVLVDQPDGVDDQTEEDIVGAEEKPLLEEPPVGEIDLVDEVAGVAETKITLKALEKEASEETPGEDLLPDDSDEPSDTNEIHDDSEPSVVSQNEPERSGASENIGSGDDLSIEQLMESIIADRKFDASYMREQNAKQSFDVSEDAPEDPAVEEAIVDDARQNETEILSESAADYPIDISEVAEEKITEPVEDEIVLEEDPLDAEETSGEDSSTDMALDMAISEDNVDEEPEISGNEVRDSKDERIKTQDNIVTEVDALEAEAKDFNEEFDVEQVDTITEPEAEGLDENQTVAQEDIVLEAIDVEAQDLKEDPADEHQTIVTAEKVTEPGFGDAIPEFLSKKQAVDETASMVEPDPAEHPLQQETEAPLGEGVSKSSEVSESQDEASSLPDETDALLEPDSGTDDLVLAEEEEFLVEDEAPSDDLTAFVETLEEDSREKEETTEEPQDEVDEVVDVDEGLAELPADEEAVPEEHIAPPSAAEKEPTSTDEIASSPEISSSQEPLTQDAPATLDNEELQNSAPINESTDQGVSKTKKRGSVIERAMAFINPTFGQKDFVKEEPQFTKGATTPLHEDKPNAEDQSLDEAADAIAKVSETHDVNDDDAEGNKAESVLLDEIKLEVEDRLTEEGAETTEPDDLSGVIEIEENDATLPEEDVSPGTEYETDIIAFDDDEVAIEEQKTLSNEQQAIESTADHDLEDEIFSSAENDAPASEETDDSTAEVITQDTTIEVTDEDIFMESQEEGSSFEDQILNELTTDLVEEPAVHNTELSEQTEEEQVAELTEPAEVDTIVELDEVEEEEPPDELTLAALKSTLKQIVGYIKREDANHNRSRDSLYNILTAIYEFHSTCETSPNAYAELVQEHDLKVQSRAPFTPILKICLGKDYDKTRLTEYAAALGIARYMNIDIDEFHAFIKNFPGGIKGCVKEMRVIRKHGASGNITARKTRSIEEAREILREMAPIASFRLKKVIVGNNIDEFCLLLAKRDGHDINVIKILDDKYTKLDPVLKRAAFIKGNLNDRK